MLERPLVNSYWVEAERLLAGEYPGAMRKKVARQKLRALLLSGVTDFIDLTEAHELRSYRELLDEEASTIGRVVNHRRMAIPDFSVPTIETMTRILDVIDQTLAADRRVYVHCWGGIGRTGTVIGCYLVRHGFSGEAALQQIAQWRADTPKADRPSPETEGQRQLVLSWRG